MKQKTILVAVSLALMAAIVSPAIAADATKPATAGQPSADTILKQMSDTLGAVQQFGFKANREISSTLAAAKNLQATAQIQVQVKRPNKVVATSTNKDGVRSIFFDGKNLTMLDGKENMYSTVPLHSSLDGLAVELAQKYGFVPPLADFVISNPYKDMTWRAQSITDAGRATYHPGFLGLGGVLCDRLTLTGKFADSELWIAVSDHLPRKVISTMKGGNAGETVKIEFTDWNLAAPVTDQTFVFAPPQGAQKIPMITTADAQAASKRKQ